MQAVEKEETLLHSFIIFNIVPPKKEGAKPEIYWYYSPEEQNEETRLNQVGLILTFAGFCRKFTKFDNPRIECDYIYTNKHEIAIQQLFGDIFMSVTIESTKPFNRYVLQSILQYCKSMFSHFWVYLPEEILADEESPSNDLIISNLDNAFGYIIHSIDWAHLDFMYLFKTYTRQKINGDFDKLKNLCAKLIVDHRKELDNIAILYRNHRVVHTTFSPTVTRVLAFGMRKKFRYLYLHNPRADRDALTWIIGMYTDMNGLKSLYQPVIYISGIPHLLVAFKLKHFKIVLTLNPNIEVDMRMLNEIPQYLKELRTFLKDIQATKPNRDVPVPFALAEVNMRSQQLHFDCSQIDAKSRPAVDINIIRGHQAAVITDISASVAFPGISDYFVTVSRRKAEDKEIIVTCKSPTPNISDSLKICQRISVIKDQGNKNQGFPICAI